MRWCLFSDGPGGGRRGHKRPGPALAAVVSHRGREGYRQTLPGLVVALGANGVKRGQRCSRRRPPGAHQAQEHRNG